MNNHKIPAFLRLKSQNSKCFSGIYHKIPRFFGVKITKFRKNRETLPII